jgi:hypothetical protein
MNPKIKEAIKKELDPIDVEQRYRDLLDEVYPEVKIGYATYSPSQIVEELSPTDFRVGVADYTGTEENLTEVDGEYYDTSEVDEITERIEDEEVKTQGEDQ